jgi:glycosyltransferase involved in cell wall biosynthesis
MIADRFEEPETQNPKPGTAMNYPRKIRVLETIRQGQIGGGESHLLDLVENLDKDLFEPVVLSFTEGPMVDRLIAMGIPTHVIHTTRPFDISKWGRVKKLIEAEKFDLVHAHGTRAHSNVSWAARQLRLPLVYTVHGWSFHDNQKFPLKNLRVMGEKYLTAKASVNISVSKSVHETGQQYFRGYRSVIIPNGINQQKFDPARPMKDVRAELNIPRDAVLVLFLARFTEQKQPLTMIRSFAKAAAENETLRLLMVGDGEQKRDADALVAITDMSGKIIMQSFRQDVPDILAAADIYVLPSLWEGLPLGLLEAMAMGKAVIASRADGTKEVIHHESNGILVNVENLEEEVAAAITRLSHDPSLRARLGEQARATITATYSAAKMTREVEEIYRELVKMRMGH